MKEMKFLNNYEIVDGKAREDISKLSQDYIKNRTHWVESGIKTIFSEECVYNSNLSGHIMTKPFEEYPKDGTDCIVTYNGENYNSKIYIIEDDGVTVCAIGDVYTVSGGTIGTENASEPFAIIATLQEMEGLYGYVIDLTGITTPISVEIKIDEEVIHKLDNKYLDLAWMPIENKVLLAKEKIITSSISTPTETTGGFPDLTKNDVFEGQKLIVVWDGIEYETEVVTIIDNFDGTTYWAGGLELLGGNPSAYPFVLQFLPTKTNVLFNVNTTKETYVASVYGFVPEKIPQKFLPDDLNTYATKEEVNKLSQEIVDYESHKANTNIHVTTAEKQTWNKVTEKVDKTGITLGEHTDGLIYIFIDGVPKGNGVEMGTTGDIVGFVDSDNNIVLTGELADGTYTIVYENADGEQTAIGGFTLGAVLELFVPATCTLNSRIGSSGSISSQNSTFVTDYIDIGDVAPSGTKDILFSGFQIQMGRSSSPYTGIEVYDSSKARLGKDDTEYNDAIEYDDSGRKTFKATVNNPSTSKTARYIRVYGHLGEEYATQGTTALTSTDQLANCSLILG